jgi:hypothetical protein
MPDNDTAPGAQALHKQLDSDAGPHATPDQKRAAEKRRAALVESEGRNAKPEHRHAAPAETVASKPAKRA